MLSFLHKVLICKTAILLQLCQFWNTIQSKLAEKCPYTLSIRGMRIRLLKLQKNDKEAKKLRSKRLTEGWKNIEQVFYYQVLSYVSKIICSKLISKHHNHPLASYFSIEKTWELITKKYYWLTLGQDIKIYVKGYDICLTSKVICLKLCRNLHSLLVSTY